MQKGITNNLQATEAGRDRELGIHFVDLAQGHLAALASLDRVRALPSTWEREGETVC